MVRRRSNGNRRGNANTPIRRLRRVMDRLESGVKFVPGPDPPEITTAPWWPITLVWRTAEDNSITFKDCFTTLLALLGMKFWANAAGNPNTKAIAIRPQTIRMWGLEKQPINMAVHEIIGGGSDRLKQMADLGSGINFSRLGFRWGAAARIDPASAESEVILARINPNKKPCLVYVQILFSVHDAAIVSDIPVRLPQQFNNMDLGSEPTFVTIP